MASLTVGHGILPRPMRSLVFIVNHASGGRRGPWLINRLRQRIAGDRLVLLHEVDLPVLVASLAPNAGRVALVACGGDGTAAAVLESAWAMDPDAPIPVGIIPLGTGNDLARVLGWRRTLDESSLDHHLHALETAQVRPIDRWVLHGPGFTRAFGNYLSVGSDARIAARFHAIRDHHPWLARATWANRSLYGAASLGEGTPEGIPATGLDLPPWCRAMVFANIPSYAGGAQLAPGIDPRDGRLDLIALGPPAAMGLALAGLRRPWSGGRRPQWRFTLPRPRLAQADGEPLRLPAGPYVVAPGGQWRVLVG